METVALGATHEPGPSITPRRGHNVAADLGVIADHRAEFREAGVDPFSFCAQDDVLHRAGSFLFFRPEFQVRQFDAGAQIGIRTQNAVPHIGEMPRLRAVQKDAVLYFGRMAHDGARPDEAAAPQIRPVSHFRA